MIQTQVFVATHYGAGGSMLMTMLGANRRFGKVSREDGQTYRDPTVLAAVQRDAAARQPQARVFVDRLIANHELSHDFYYENVLFVFLVREPEESIKYMMETGYTEAAALRYYSYRLRRLCEMARKARHKIVVAWDELADKSAFPAIKEFLGLKELTSIYRPEKSKETVAGATVSSARRCYERHLRYLRAVTRRPSRTATPETPPAS